MKEEAVGDFSKAECGLQCENVIHEEVGNGGGQEAPKASQRSLFRLLCDKNPFYLLSALLAIYAQSALFTSDPLRPDTELPALLLAFYTALLAGAGVLVVRLGKVWDDARSVVLLVLVLLQLLPVGLDGILMSYPTAGPLWMGGLLAFSVFISELLRRGLRIKLAKDLLAVYYLFLALNCGWPLLLSHLVRTCESNTAPVAQAILLFPIVGGLLLLFLIPAIRRGPEAVESNGTPWGWPHFPWSAFVVVAAGVGFRTYLMAISFIGGKGAGPYANLESGFLPWMLAFLLLAVGVLFIEEASLRKTSWATRLAVIIPFAALFLCLMVPAGGELSSSCSRTFVRAIPGGHPPYALCVPFLMAYFAWGWFRGVKGMGDIFHTALGVLSIGALASEASSHSFPFLKPWMPMAVFAADMLAVSIAKRQSAYGFFSGLAIWLCVLPHIKLGCDEGPTVFFFGVLAAGYICGALFNDKFASFLKHGAAMAIPLCLLFSMFSIDASCGFPHALASSHMAMSIIGLLILMGVIGLLFSRDVYVMVCAANAALLLAVGAYWSRGWLVQAYSGVKHAMPVLLSLSALALAVLISLWKGGALPFLKKAAEAKRE